MIRNIFIITFAAALLFSFGCKSKRQQASPPPKSVAVNIQKQAEEQITEKNMDAELDKMEKEIKADANSN